MPELHFDTYYRYADLTAIVQGFAEQFAALCRVQSIGQSYEGRDLWCVTLTNTATGPDSDKPAFWVDANIHATEVSPGACALYAIHKILNGYGNDGKITRLLDTRALYIVPRFNPDGAELFSVSVFHDFKYHPKETIKGVFDDWLYDHLGVYAWTCELWSPQTQAGIEMKKDNKWQFIEWFRDHPVDDDLKMFKWNDEVLEGKGFINWYKAQHPQLGEVELGGWHDDYCWRNPPLHLLEKEIAPHADFIIWHALISPLLEFREVTVTPMNGGRDVPVERLGSAEGDARPEGDDPSGRLYHIRALVQNTGWLGTTITKRAEEKKLIRPLEVELTLPDGATLVSGERRTEAGHLSGRALKNTVYWGSDPTTDRAKVEWVVRASPGSTLTLTASHQRAGKVSRAIIL